MPNQIKSLSKGLKVYRFIVDYGKPILAVTLCEKLQIDKSTMSRLLKTLKDEDFKDKTLEFKAMLEDGKSLEDIVVPAFALALGLAQCFGNLQPVSGLGGLVFASHGLALG